jgi:hypothetical protein
MIRAMRLIVIAGPAGSGKSTLADLLAVRLDGVHVDFDVVTGAMASARSKDYPLLSEPELLERVKDERYAEFSSAVRVAGSVGWPDSPVIASAPFTSITQSPGAWANWCATCGARGDLTSLFWLDIEPELRLARLRQRGSSRDLPHLDGSTFLDRVPRPAVAHHLIDAGLPLGEQAALVAEIVS